MCLDRQILCELPFLEFVGFVGFVVAGMTVPAKNGVCIIFG